MTLKFCPPSHNFTGGVKQRGSWLLRRSGFETKQHTRHPKQTREDSWPPQIRFSWVFQLHELGDIIYPKFTHQKLLSHEWLDFAEICYFGSLRVWAVPSCSSLKKNRRGKFYKSSKTQRRIADWVDIHKLVQCGVPEVADLLQLTSDQIQDGGRHLNWTYFESQ